MQVGTWIGGFGMERMPDEHLQHVRASLRMLLFPGTTILSHRLPAAPIPIDPPPSLWTVWPPFLNIHAAPPPSPPPPPPHRHARAHTHTTIRPVVDFICPHPPLSATKSGYSSGAITLRQPAVACIRTLSCSCSDLSTPVRYRLLLPPRPLHDA